MWRGQEKVKHKTSRDVWFTVKNELADVHYLHNQIVVGCRQPLQPGILRQWVGRLLSGTEQGMAKEYYQSKI